MSKQTAAGADADSAAVAATAVPGHSSRAAAAAGVCGDAVLFHSLSAASQ